jgi:tetratricopeptide (TPR) repeat protein
LALAGLAALTCVVLAGCPAQPSQPAASPATGPAAASRPAPVEEIPAGALLHLEQLKPTLEKPVNPASAAEVSSFAKQSVADAEKLMAAKDYAGAIAPLDRAIGYDAKNPKVLRMRGLAYLGLGDKGRAEENLLKAVEQVPDDLEAQVSLGNILASAQKIPEATLAYRKALLCTGVEPNEPLAAEATLNLGALLEQQKYWTAASECYARLGGWLENPPARYAQRAALQQLMLRPERLMVRRGTVLLLLHRPKEAQGFLESANKLNRTDTLTASMLIRCMIELKNFSGVEALLVRLSADLDEPDLGRFVPAAAEETARTAGDPAMPSRIWKALARKTQGDYVLALGLAQACRRLGANDAAIEVLQSVFQSMPENVGMARELAELSAEVGKPQQGLAILVKTLAADESSAPAIDQGLRQLVRALPEGFEEQQAAKPPVDPNESFAFHYAVGRLAHLRFKTALAIAEYRKSIDARKGFRPTREALLDTALDQRQFDQAREQLAGLDKIVEPWFVDYLRGKMELSEGNLPEAVKSLEKSFGANGQFAPALLLLAEVDHRKGQNVAALNRLDAALKLPGDKMEIVRRRFPILLELGRFRQTETELDALRRGAPDNLELGVMEALLFLRTSQRDKAATLIADLAKKYPDSGDVMVLSLQVDLGPVNGILSKSDLDRCRKRLDETLRRDPRSTMARKFLAEAYLLSARYVEAAASAKKLHDDEPRDIEIAHLATQIALRARQYPMAKDILEATLRLAPGDPYARQNMLTVLERLKDSNRAIDLAGKWLSQATEDNQKTLYRLYLLRLYDEANANDQALKLLQDWAKSAGALLTMVKESQIRLLARMDKVDDALKIATEMSGGPAGQFKARLTLIAGLNQARKYDRSIKLLDEWIGKRKDPNVEYLISRIETWSEANRPDKVRAAALEWLAADPLAYEPRGLLMISLTKAEKYDEALKLLGEWRTKLAAATQPASAPATPAQVRALLILDRLEAVTGNTLFLSEKYDEALKLAEAAIAKDPNDAEMFDLKSSCLSRLGKKKESLDALEAAWKLEQFDAQRMNNLGYVYADRGVDLDRAELMIRRSLAAAEARNQEALQTGGRQRATLHILDSLGWVLYKKGSFHEAAFIFEDGIRKEEDKRSLAATEGDADDEPPISSVIYDHAGDAFWKLGWSDRAMEYWKQAVESSVKEKRHDPDARDVAARTPLKIKAVQSGKPPAVAPLGEGVKEETK